jgi:hypothetical protein
MYNAIVALVIFFAASAHAGTCTSISRSNFSPNTVISSSTMNTQLNAVFAHTNDLDGGCIDDGTLEVGALNSTDFAPLYKSLRQGCAVTRSDANTLSVDKCLLSLGTVFVTTTTATTVTWSANGGASESASTRYYLYVLTTSTSSALTLRISSTAPAADGFDASGNRVLATFYNNASSDIDQYSIDDWVINRFVPTNTAPANYTPTFTGFGTTSPTTNQCKWNRIGGYAVIDCFFTYGTNAASLASMTLPTGFSIDTTKIIATNTTGNPGQPVGSGLHNGAGSGTYFAIVTATGTSSTLLYFTNGLGASTFLTPVNSNAHTDSVPTTYNIRVPIAGWSD